MSIIIKSMGILCTVGLFGGAHQVRDYCNSLKACSQSFADSPACHERAVEFLNKLHEELGEPPVDQDTAKSIIDMTFKAVSLSIVFAAPEYEISEELKGLAYYHNPENPNQIVRISGFVVNIGCKGKFITLGGQEISEVYHNGNLLTPPEDFSLQIVNIDRNFFDRDPDHSFFKDVDLGDCDLSKLEEYTGIFKQYNYCRTYWACIQFFPKPHFNGEVNKKLLDYWLTRIKLGHPFYTLKDVSNATSRGDLRRTLFEAYNFLLPVFMLFSIPFWSTEEGLKIMAQVVNEDHFGYPSRRLRNDILNDPCLEQFSVLIKPDLEALPSEQYRAFQIEEKLQQKRIDEWDRNVLVSTWNARIPLTSSSPPSLLQQFSHKASLLFNTH